MHPDFFHLSATQFKERLQSKAQLQSREKMRRVNCEMRSSLETEVFRKKRSSATLQHWRKFEPARILGNTSGVSLLKISGKKF